MKDFDLKNGVISVALWRPSEVDDKWFPERPRWGGGVERVLFPCGNRSACLVICEVMNMELRAMWDAMVKDMKR